MMLRCSRKYDIKTDSIVYANNQPYTRDNYSSASISYVADSLFNFCRRMCLLKVDNAEYALLTAIVIFSGMFLLYYITFNLYKLIYDISIYRSTTFIATPKC